MRWARSVELFLVWCFPAGSEPAMQSRDALGVRPYRLRAKSRAWPFFVVVSAGIGGLHCAKGLISALSACIVFRNC